ncbi:MAG: hypothetical protein DMG30_21445 [Acidobacteria bacterium]|nr:MAG: hypothetical protein DMG30_21445 [Acidobacteriota bacterium]
MAGTFRPRLEIPFRFPYLQQAHVEGKSLSIRAPEYLRAGYLGSAVRGFLVHCRLALRTLFAMFFNSVSLALKYE